MAFGHLSSSSVFCFSVSVFDAFLMTIADVSSAAEALIAPSHEDLARWDGRCCCRGSSMSSINSIGVGSK